MVVQSKVLLFAVMYSSKNVSYWEIARYPAFPFTWFFFSYNKNTNNIIIVSISIFVINEGECWSNGKVFLVTYRLRVRPLESATNACDRVDAYIILSELGMLGTISYRILWLGHGCEHSGWRKVTVCFFSFMFSVYVIFCSFDTGWSRLCGFIRQWT